MNSARGEFRHSQDCEAWSDDACTCGAHARWLAAGSPITDSRGNRAPTETGRVLGVEEIRGILSGEESDASLTTIALCTSHEALRAETERLTRDITFNYESAKAELAATPQLRYDLARTLSALEVAEREISSLSSERDDLRADAEEAWNAAGSLRVYRDELLAEIARLTKERDELREMVRSQYVNFLRPSPDKDG